MLQGALEFLRTNNRSAGNHALARLGAEDLVSGDIPCQVRAELLKGEAEGGIYAGQRLDHNQLVITADASESLRDLALKLVVRETTVHQFWNNWVTLPERPLSGEIEIQYPQNESAKIELSSEEVARFREHFSPFVEEKV